MASVVIWAFERREETSNFTKARGDYLFDRSLAPIRGAVEAQGYLPERRHVKDVGGWQSSRTRKPDRSWSHHIRSNHRRAGTSHEVLLPLTGPARLRFSPTLVSIPCFGAQRGLDRRAHGGSTCPLRTGSYAQQRRGS